MTISRIFLKEYSRRGKIKLEYAESMLWEEICNDKLDVSKLRARCLKFVIISKFHKLRLISGKAVNGYIKKFESFKNLNLIKGIIGNRGSKKGIGFCFKK